MGLTQTMKKSTRSNGGGDCVEVADNLAEAVILVRDSKDNQGPVLTFDHTTWRAFIDDVKRGDIG